MRAEIARRLEVKIEDVKPSPVEGLYEIRSGAEVGYVSTDGRFYVDGDVFDMTSKANLTEQRRQEGRISLMAGVSDDDAIIFAPTGATRHTLTVFTDIDCTYCRRLHQEIGELNRLGIRVRYLMYPRNGPDTEAWRKAEAVWCSADRRDALTRAKRGETIKSAQVRDADRRALRAGPAAGDPGHAGHHHGPGRVPRRLPPGGEHGGIPGNVRQDRRSALSRHRSSSGSLSFTSRHSSASAGGSPRCVITGHCFASSALIARNGSWPAGTSSSE